MKLSNNTRNISSEGALRSGEFNISEEDQAHMLGILRNRIYTDKIAAVLREYGTNAADAHIEAKKSELPFQVQLPTITNRELRIRDYGPGLSEEDIYNVYTRYGHSTKRDSNSQAGMLGLGSKSAFGYGDQFFITSWYNGEVKKYLAFINERDHGQANLVHVGSCDPEETGIEIQIPVRASDIDKFTTAASKVFFTFEPVPIVKNARADLLNYEIVKSGSFWKIARGVEAHCVVMGGVNYPLPSKLVSNLWGRRYFGYNRVGYSLLLTMPVGSFDPTASREAVEENPRSLKAISNQISRLYDEVLSEVKSKLDETSTWIEALQLLQEYGDIFHFRNIESLCKRGKLPQSAELLEKLGEIFRMRRNGKSVMNREVSLAPEAGLPLKVSTIYKNNQRRSRREPSLKYHESYNGECLFIGEDRRALARLMKWREKNGSSSAYLVEYTTKDPLERAAAIIKWISQTGLEGIKVVRLNQTTVPLEDVRSSSPQAKKQGWKLLKSPNYLMGGGTLSSRWRLHDTLPAGVIIWAEIKRNRIQDQESANTLLALAETGFIKKSQLNILGLTSKEIKLVQPEWVSLKDFVEESLRTLPAAKLEFIDYAQLFSKKGRNEVPKDYLPNAIKHLPAGHEFIEFLTLLADVKCYTYNNIKDASRFGMSAQLVSYIMQITSALKSTSEELFEKSQERTSRYLELTSTFKSRYPLLYNAGFSSLPEILLRSHATDEEKSSHIKAVMEYIESMDLYKNKEEKNDS